MRRAVADAFDPPPAITCGGSFEHALVVDDHAVVRMGVVQMLRQTEPTLRLAEASTLAEAEAALAGEAGSALVVLDVFLPDVPVDAPLEGLRRLRRRYPGVAVAMLSADSDAELAAQALREGAAGWLPKSADPRLFGAALALVLRGGCYVPPFLFGRDRSPAAEPLSPRQLDVLRCLVEGRSNKEIARDLALSESTVKTHLATIFRVLKVRNRTEAVVAGQARLRSAPPARGR
jgi:DNA-binding NarL/FixJ family response regulator